MSHELPRNAVDNPILNSPFHEPTRYWDFSGPSARVGEGRRPAGYTGLARTERAGDVAHAQQQQILLHTVNDIRARVKEWRARNYPNVSRTTRDLLDHWNDPARRPIFFCQREAAETIIYLVEASEADRQGIRIEPDVPVDPESVAKGYLPLTRYCTKMATGSGKTTVMAMLAAWSILNRLTNKTDGRFTDAILVVAPNLTVKDRLGVLDPNVAGSYYERFDLVPRGYRELLARGKVQISNWHEFLVRSDEGKRGVVQRGVESDAAFVRRVLKKLRGAQQILVLNDEAHHAWRPAKPIEDQQTELEGLSRDERDEAKDEAEEATVWVGGLDRINKVLGKGPKQPGIKLCIDLSATPFALKGSGRPEGEPLPWIVSDFSLVDAIESGITKVPRIPVRDDSGKPDPQYFHLWRTVLEKLSPAERGGARAAPSPDAVWREAQGALSMLAGKWQETLAEFRASGQPVPPAMIVVAANTKIAQVIAEHVRAGYVLGELAGDVSFQIDTSVLKEAESETGGASKKVQEQLLRLKVATVGKAQWEGSVLPASVQNLPDEARAQLAEPPGKHVRCVVSVGMLTEGWDAQNVTQILGLRAFSSQLLCEQVVGRALRRMSYEVNDDGMLEPEYADIFGVPFEVIPVQGTGTRPPKPPQPSTLVQADPARKHLAIEFPRVEGYVLDVKQRVRCDVESIPSLTIEPSVETTLTQVAPSLPTEGGRKFVGVMEELETFTRLPFHEEHRLQKTAFRIAADIVRQMTRAHAGDGESTWSPGQAQVLFPQVLTIVEDVFDKRLVAIGGARREEVALEKYAEKVRTRILDAIEPDDDLGETPLLPRIERHRPIGSTEDVQFRTTKTAHPTTRSHVSHLVVDSGLEGQAMLYLEHADLADVVVSYVKNDRLGFVIPYEIRASGDEMVSRSYLPDFLVRVRADDGGEVTVILETKGWRNEDAKTKESAAQRWVKAINHHGGFGRWRYEVLEDASAIPALLRGIAQPSRFELVEPAPARTLEADDELRIAYAETARPARTDANRTGWEDWVAATRTRSWMLADPLLDWLDLYGVEKGFERDDARPGFDPRTDFTRFVMTKSREFEQAVVRLISQRANVVRISRSPEHTADPRKAEETLAAMRDGVEVIHEAVLHDLETRTYGAPDLLVRSDVLERLFPDALELDAGWFDATRPDAPSVASVRAPGLGERPWHYRVVDAKFTTLHLLESGELGNEGSARAYKAQLFLYNRALGRAQGFLPPSSFLLGRGWEQGKARGRSCMDRLAWVPQDGRLAKGRSLADEVEAAVQWVRKVRDRGSEWSVLPLISDDALRPNMKNTLDAPWHGAKRRIASETKDLTLLWQVGVDRRAAAIEKKIRAWDDKRLTAEDVGLKGPKTKPVFDALLEVNRDASGPPVRPARVQVAEGEWRRPSELEFFVDFETISDLDDDFEKLPERGGQPLIFMVGCGHIENGDWVFRCFTADALDAESEARVLTAWFDHMRAVQARRGTKGAPRVFHWSPAEVSNLETAYNSARRRHPSAEWPVPEWFDFLNRVIKAEPVVVRGALGFGLKAIAKALHTHGLVKTSWSDGPTDGLGAMVAAWSAQREARERGCALRDIDLAREVERYNEVDCRVMWETIEYLRASH
ncbi:BPTD_3080 family restriction endonuclease [Sandaracinus amylolyticus]|uniref:Type III restriction-modification enzyme, helicase subunit n=1 Tax=Sandaracinus amylolyticus TaxID=927083 RepID=A0A0F6VZF8_9BACT|nr:DEAD/DEAH box helicase family protein [Sandaracinus amylolyticus]AKF03415.1 Type III restriction-modification enzyme, helicase subunit [Sandaracinus amylolyticus]